MSDPAYSPAPDLSLIFGPAAITPLQAIDAHTHIRMHTGQRFTSPEQHYAQHHADLLTIRRIYRDNDIAQPLVNTRYTARERKLVLTLPMSNVYDIKEVCEKNITNHDCLLNQLLRTIATGQYEVVFPLSPHALNAQREAVRRLNYFFESFPPPHVECDETGNAFLHLSPRQYDTWVSQWKKSAKGIPSTGTHPAPQQEIAPAAPAPPPENLITGFAERVKTRPHLRVVPREPASVIPLFPSTDRTR